MQSRHGCKHPPPKLTSALPLTQFCPQVDVFYLYTYGTGLWLAVQALPLVVTPKLIVLLLAEESHHVSGKSAFDAKKQTGVPGSWCDFAGTLSHAY
jgi:hypothetical protein